MYRYASSCSVLLLFALSAALRSAAAEESEKFRTDSKYYLLETLQNINPNIAWDDSEYLDGIAEEYATCRSLDQLGILEVSERTPEGQAIRVILDSERGALTDYMSAQVYVRHIVHAWTHQRELSDQFQDTDLVSCRTMAGCGGFFLLSCAFSYSGPGDEEPITGFQQPFSVEQYYQLLEKASGRRWYVSGLLESLAGDDISCSIVEEGEGEGEGKWRSWATEEFNKSWIGGMRVEYGVSEVDEGTDGAASRAVEDIVMRQFNRNLDMDRVGCALIENCGSAAVNKFYLVVVCLYT